MVGELLQGVRHSARQCVTPALGAVALAVGMWLFVEPQQIHQEFYEVLATTIPILLFALLVRLASMRDVIVEMLDEAQDESDIAELRDKAHPEDSTSRARLDALSERRKGSAKQLEELAPRMLAGLLAAFLIAAIAEIACLGALAMSESTAGTLYISSLGTAVVAYSVATNEVATYKLSFGQRGLLLPAHLRKPAKD